MAYVRLALSKQNGTQKMSYKTLACIVLCLQSRESAFWLTPVANYIVPMYAMQPYIYQFIKGTCVCIWLLFCSTFLFPNALLSPKTMSAEFLKFIHFYLSEGFHIIFFLMNAGSRKAFGCIYEKKVHTQMLRLLWASFITWRASMEDASEILCIQYYHCRVISPYVYVCGCLGGIVGRFLKFHGLLLARPKGGLNCLSSGTVEPQN